MINAQVSELKRELQGLSAQRLTELCLRLAKYKKENKELLAYILFESDAEDVFIRNVKQETDEQFAAMNTTNIYYAKKSIRKILRTLNKYIRFSGKAQTAAELLMHFCSAVQDSGIKLNRSTALQKLYNAQVVKIKKYIATMHEDLQYDLLKELAALE